MTEYSPLKEFVKKFVKQKMAVVASIVVLLIIILGLISPLIVPYDPDRPVTLQYAKKGIAYEKETSVELPVSFIQKDGTVIKKNTYIRGKSGNRRVASVRVVKDSLKITAVNRGQTYVLITAGDISAALKVSVSQPKGEPIVSRLVVKGPDNPLKSGETYQLNIAGYLSNGELLTDEQKIIDIVKDFTSGTTQNMSGGWSVSGKKEVKPEFRSLTPQFVSVTDQGVIRAIRKGLGKIKVSVGELSTVVFVSVDSDFSRPMFTDIELDTWEVQLNDIYKHQPPSKRHWFGTDHQNRDIFSRVLVGTRATLIIGFVSVFIGSILGTFLGLLAGYYGGWLDNLLTRFCDVLLAFPGILLAIAVIAILGPGLINIIFAVAVFSVPIFLRIVRGSTLELKNMTYVEAARSIGVKDIVIIMRHIFPGTLSIVLVYLTMRIGTAILIGASLSFLGLGGDITAPEWGAMLSAAKDNSRNFFHPIFFPGLAIVITVLAFNLLGDGLRDALDPKIND